MKSKLLLCCCLSILSLYSLATGRANHGKIDHISLKEGLSHIGVTCFCSDSKGFLWIGTFDGLNRYDGRNFVSYNHQPGDEQSLINNRVSCVLEYDPNHLLIGTESGLCIFDKRTESFKGIDAPAEPILKFGHINKISRDESGSVWMLVDNSFLFQLSNDWRVKRKINIKDFQLRARVIDFSILQPGQFLLLTNTNVYHLGSELEVLRNENVPRRGIYRAIIKVDKNIFYLLKNDGFDKVSLNIEVSHHSISLLSSELKGHDCISGFFDSKRNLWVGTKNSGAFCYSIDKDTQLRHFSNNNDKQLSSNWISCIFEDRVGGIWFGTTEKGINRFNPDRSYFSAYQYNPDNKYGFSNAYITGLTQLKNGLILIGSRKDGIAIYNPAKKQFVKSWFSTKPIDDKTVNAIYEDSRGAIWFSSEGEIFRLIPGQKQLEQIASRSLFQRADLNVMSFCEDDFGTLWVGTRQGMYWLQIDEDHHIENTAKNIRQQENPLNDVIVTTIYNDPVNNDMWVGTWSDGLFHITPKEEQVGGGLAYRQYAFTEEQVSSLRSNFVSSIHRATNNQLWIGTEGGGFSRFISDSQEFEHFNMESGLSNNVVKTIAEDKQGRLWVSTNNGLNLFHPANKTFKIFTEQNGLASNYFNKTQVKLRNGIIVLGGNNGLTVFAPDRIGESNYLAVPEFGQFQLSYETIEPGEMINDKVILAEALPYTSDIELEYDQNVFSIEMLGVHFDDANDLRYQYRLRGYDKNWLTVRSIDNFAAYTNVPFGKYTFEFKVANGFEQWSSETKSIAITIHPPFWLSPLAYVVYVVLIILILVVVFFVLIKIERLNHKVKFEQFEKEKEKELHDVKLKFFTNISHEFRTPVSLILGPVDSLLSQFAAADGIRHNLLLIKKQGNYLLRLLEQLLEFRKAESEALELKCQKADIVEHVKWIFKGFERQAGDKNIRFRFKAEQPMVIWFDAGKVDKIAYNLISNAIKYTPDNGEVSVSFSLNSENMAVMEVKDSGIGLDEEEQKNVFNRFYRAESNNDYQGTGIGLALAQSLAKLHNGFIKVKSQKGHGSGFSFFIPTDDAYLTAEQKDTNTVVVPEAVKSDVADKDTLVNQDFYPKVEEGKTILVVEDHVEMRQFLVDTLGSSYLVKSCNNGMAAFDKACNLIPDLIISDVMMPGMTGVELLQKLKTEIVTSHIPVILLTAKNEIADTMEGLEYGADDYLGKPFHIDLLKARVKSLLVNRELLHKRYAAGLKAFDETSDIPELKREVEFINSLNQLIETHLQDSEFGSDELSKALFISRTGFYKKMKDITGKTPGEYLKDYRINKSGDLLKTGDYSVSEVINLVGFKSRSHFYKCFKEVFGQLPADYIKSNS